MSTLQSIRENVQRHLSDTASNKYFTVSELNQFIGEAYRYYVLMMIEQGEGYFKYKTNIPLTAGVAEISLSALNPAFMSISRLERNTEQYQIPLVASERRFGANENQNNASGGFYTPSYRMRDLTLILEPAPQFTEIASATTGLGLEYNYQPAFPSASSPNNFVFDATFAPLYEPMIELYASISAMESKDATAGISDSNSFRVRLQKWESRFLESLNRYEYPDSIVRSSDIYGYF